MHLKRCKGENANIFVGGVLTFCKKTIVNTVETRYKTFGVLI